MQFKRRILLCVTGLSPQVVTETCFALTQNHANPWVPTEIHVITTRVGAENARLNLLSESKGWFHRLRMDFNLPEIKFDPSTIHVICDENGRPLDDIRSPSDNQAAADFICDIVRELTSDDEVQVHVSIAGGRKSMGYYVGYAISLFGRPQDELSHVLVSQAFENSPYFYYPTPYEYPVDTRQGDKILTLDAKSADVALARIPFVRLRLGQPLDVLNGGAKFTEVVTAVQRSLQPASLIIDLQNRQVKAGCKVIGLPPAQLAFLSWFARRAKVGAPSLLLRKQESSEYAQAFLKEYRAIVGKMGSEETTSKRLEHGMDGDTFSEFKSKLHKKLKAALGPIESSKYEVIGLGSRGAKSFSLALDAQAIAYSKIK